jgi:hypothetical protein
MDIHHLPRFKKFVDKDQGDSGTFGWVDDQVDLFRRVLNIFIKEPRLLHDGLELFVALTGRQEEIKRDDLILPKVFDEVGKSGQFS